MGQCVSRGSDMRSICVDISLYTFILRELVRPHGSSAFSMGYRVLSRRASIDAVRVQCSMKGLISIRASLASRWVLPSCREFVFSSIPACRIYQRVFVQDRSWTLLLDILTEPCLFIQYGFLYSNRVFFDLTR